MESSSHIRMMVFASLMAALIAIGSYLSIPIGPVPIVLQNLFVLLAGLLLGSRWGAAAVGVFLLAGACGLPVFAGGAGGIGRFAGPTGGYLIGFLIATFVVGLLTERAKPRLILDVAAMVAGTLVIYAFGVPWLKVVTGMSLSKALMVGMVPFLVGDALKIAAAVLIARALRPVIGRVPVDRAAPMEGGEP